jgi:hypothetical protein
MNTRLAKNILEIIRSEEERRISLLDDKDSDAAYDQWVFKDAPFLAELCLMLLVALRHQVERELVVLAARAANDGKEIDGKQCQKRVKELQDLPLSKRWKTIEARLKPQCCLGAEAIEALRLLANSYKHDPSKEPAEDLLKLLNLEVGVNYAPLPESDALREALAASVGLNQDADYCDIAETFLDIVDIFLTDVRRQPQISRVKWGAASLNPKDFAR